MLGIKVNRIMFLTEFSRESKMMEECCAQISFSDNGELVWSGARQDAPDKRAIYAIRNFPPYLRISFKGTDTHRHLKYASLGGFAIKLEPYPNLDTFLSRHLRKKVKGHLMRSLKRLEFSYEIRYRHLYGDADSEECRHYLALLKGMIANRFAERNQENHALNTWDQLENTVPVLVAAKKASIFVISNGSQALSISVSYHIGRMLFNYASSYDIDFGKFSLGNIMIYKNLEWCFNNNYRFLDLGWGELEYKSRWCNYHYDLEHHLLCPNNAIVTPLVASFEGNKTRIRSALMKSPMIRTIKDLIGSGTNLKQNDKSTLYRLAQLDASDIPSDLKEVDIGDEEYSNFRSLRNDFIYSTQELHKDVGLFYNKDANDYFIRGRGHINKIVPGN